MKTSANVTPERPSPRFLSAWFQKLALDVLIAEQLPKSVLDFLGFFWPVRFFFLRFAVLASTFLTFMKPTLAVWCFYWFFIEELLATGSQSSVIPTMHLG